MEKGFLAREEERIPRVKITSSSNEAPGGDAELRQKFDDIISDSQRNWAFFEHDAAEVDYETALGKRDPLTLNVRRVRSSRRVMRNSQGPSDLSRFDEIAPTEPSRSVPTSTSGSTSSHGPARLGSNPRISNPYVCNELHAKVTGNKGLRQVSLNRYLQPRKTRVKKKGHEKMSFDLLPENYPGSIIIPVVTRSSDLLASPVAMETTLIPSELPVTSRRPLLTDDFDVRIELEPSEENLLARFKYMFDAAAEKLSHKPPFPDGLVPFQSSMLVVQSDSTTSHFEHLMLSQALCAGRAAAQIYLGGVPNPTPNVPDWARLPPSLPGTFLKKLAEFLRHKIMLIVVPGASLDYLSQLSEKLRTLGIPAKDSSEQLPRYMVEDTGAWLASDALCYGPGSQNFFHGAILPEGAQRVPGLPCGTLRIKMDPELSNLKPTRTAFVDSHLENLTRRLEQAGVLKVENKVLNPYGVDLCSGNLGIILSHQDFTGVTRREMLRGLLSRVLRAAYCFRKLVILSLISGRSMRDLEKIIRFAEAKGIQTECDIQVVDASSSPIEEMIQHFCKINGDDVADFAFLTLRNGALASIMNEGNPNQSPHEALVSALL